MEDDRNKTWSLWVIVVISLSVHFLLFRRHFTEGLRLLGNCRVPTAGPEILPYVMSHFLDNKLRMLMWVYRGGATFMMLWMTAVGIYAIADPSWQLGPGVVYRNAMMYPVFVALLLSAEAINKEGFEKRYHLSRVRAMDCHYGLVMVCFLAQQVFTELPQPYRPIINIARMILTLVYANGLQAAVWSFIVYAVYMGFLFSHAVLDTETVIIEATWCWCMVFLAHMAQRFHWLASTTAVEARSGRNERGALEEILNATCDAVVQLDANMAITEVDSKFQALMLGKPVSVGASFETFLATAKDRQDFKAVLTAPRDLNHPAVAQAFNVSFMDIIGSLVQMQIFHAQYQTLDGKTGFIVGLCERGDHYVERQASAEIKRAEGHEWSSVLAREPQPDGGWCWPTAAAQGPITVPAEADRSAERRRRESGTPPNREARCLREQPSELDARSASSSQRSKDSMVWTHGRAGRGERLLVTSQGTMQMMLLASTNLWNFRVPRRACCHYHAVISHLRVLVKRMERQPCSPHRVERLEAQCRTCGLMRPRDQVGRHCFWCDFHQSEGSAEKSSSTSRSLSL